MFRYRSHNLSRRYPFMVNSNHKDWPARTSTPSRSPPTSRLAAGLLSLSSGETNGQNTEKRILIELSRQLNTEFGRGFSETNLEYMRRFYLEYYEVVPRIPRQCLRNCRKKHRRKHQLARHCLTNSYPGLPSAGRTTSSS
jgi:hypothetical protein